MRKLNVLSLFDGISCTQAALQRSGVVINNYYASEVDKYAIQITNKNFPNTIQLGDVNNFSSWDLPKIDLIVAGFPCQAWSSAGKQKGLDDPRGQLAITTLEAWKYFNPRYFLFENVASMSKKNRQFMDDLFGVESIMINSALVSAQNRKRLYWTNIPVNGQPMDENIALKDILEHGVVDRNKSYCIDANYFKGTNLNQYLKKCRRQVVFNYSSSGRGNGVVEDRFYESGLKKSHTITATGYTKRSFTGVYNNDNIRKLTPVECERLQTLPDNYTEGVSNTQRYKCLGNGFTVDVIAHILRGIK